MLTPPTKRPHRHSSQLAAMEATDGDCVRVADFSAERARLGAKQI
jgi:hypothetical protein